MMTVYLFFGFSFVFFLFHVVRVTAEPPPVRRKYKHGKTINYGLYFSHTQTFSVLYSEVGIRYIMPDGFFRTRCVTSEEKADIIFECFGECSTEDGFQNWIYSQNKKKQKNKQLYPFGCRPPPERPGRYIVLFVQIWKQRLIERLMRFPPVDYRPIAFIVLLPLIYFYFTWSKTI